MAKKRGGLLRVVGWALLAAAIAKELRKPEEEREWHGRVGGVVPYDFRLPTLERIRRSWWNPSDDRILTEPVFGVGWGINLPRVARELRGEG